jgi:hypothetical protein
VTKKPVYTKLQFQAAVKGDLATLVDFLERFYKLPLLHQIRNLTVTKPTSSASSRGNQFNQSPSENLDIVMTVEALVLDTAEKRSTLLPDLKPEEVPPALTPARQYAAIAGKNMFYGPTRFRTETIRSVDVRPYVKLVSITGFGDNRIVTLHDIYHNYEYEIEPRSLGGFRVTATYPLNGRKLAPPGMRNGRDLELIDPQDENNTWRFQIVKIGEHEVILRTTDEQNKQYYRLRTGDTLFDAMTTPMSRSELNALDIKEPTAPAAADDKKDGDAKEE